jgi:two-component system sensor histidine kinase CpxA
MMTGRLFSKIFLAFWLAMTLAGAILLGVEMTRSAQMAQRWRGVTGDAFAVYAASAARDYPRDIPAAELEEGDTKPRTLRQFLADLEERTMIRAWVFDSQNKEVSGYSPAARTKHPLWLRERMMQLVDLARQSGQTEFADLEGLTLTARAAPTPDGQLWVLVGMLQDSRYDFWGAAPRVQVLRLLTILAAAGAVSWFLARHLTQPLDNLRTMTRRLEAGDFSARADVRLDRRRDELAELAHDFNSMAARIEHLLREQERLLAAQRHLLADVAHELRSPLARSSVALELARDALELGPQAPNDVSASIGESLDRIERETGNLTDLIDRLLMLSRLESGVHKPDSATVDLNALVRAIVADADFEARSRQRQVRLVESEPCLTVGSTSLLRSAIENVVRNAVRHTAENTTVEVALSQADDLRQDWDRVGHFDACYTSDLPETAQTPLHSAVISVRDSGKGVPVEELSQIFRPFYRAGSGRARQSGGVGLGLTITARALELHGGQFRLCNMPNGGLEVQLRLPLLVEAER